MDLQSAQTIYLELKTSKLDVLVNPMLKAAIRYARLRVDWLQSDDQFRAEMELERTAAHNAFISQCDIVARNMSKLGEDSSWRRKIGIDRKDIGDFACMLHAVMGITAR